MVTSLKDSVAAGTGKAALRDIEEWQAIIDRLGRLPVKSKGNPPNLPVDARAAEVGAIKVG